MSSLSPLYALDKEAWGAIPLMKEPRLNLSGDASFYML